MNIWKKAISAVTSAALLASLLATATVATKGAAATDSDQTDHLACGSAAVVGLVTCSQVADGISTVTLVGDPTGDVTAGTSLYITATGATIIDASGDFVLAGGVVTDAPPINLTTDDKIVLRAPAAAGTAVVSVYRIATSNGIAALEGTLTVTFTATSGVAVSEANSTVKTVEDLTCAVQTAPKTVAPAKLPSVQQAGLCITLKDGNNKALTAAADVEVSITPVGLLSAGAVAGQVVKLTTAAGVGTANFGIWNTGAIGVATIGIKVTQGTTSTTFAPKTFTFSGDLATITATAYETAFKYNNPSNFAVRYTGKDAAGNNVYFAATATSSDTTVLTIDTTNSNLYPWNGVADTKGGRIYVNCLKVGSADVVVKSPTGTLPAAPVKVYCSDVAKTFTVKFDVATVNPGGSATFTVSALDANGLPAYATSTGGVTAIVSSGAITPGPGAQDLADGIVEYTYLAPFNTGVATALATVGGISGSKSASITIGTPAEVTTLGSTASTLGVAPPGGSWSTSTKVAKVGSFITWRFAAGVANAGKTIGVFLQTKDANGVWSAPVRFSARVADSSGNAYFSWKATSAMWVSIRGGLGDARSTPPVQGRWQ